MSLKGVDVEALRRLASDMLSCRSDVELVLSRIETQLEELPWVGPDRERFVQQWTEQKGHLQRLAQSLTQTAEAALRHLEQQAAISGEWHSR